MANPSILFAKAIVYTNLFGFKIFTAEEDDVD